MAKSGEHFNRAIIRTIISGILIIVFFIGVILMYYNAVYNEKKNGIVKDGKIEAINSAERFDRYLSTSIDIIKLNSYALDEMIRQKKSDYDIQEFLVSQSTATRSTVLENLTGLYGYINGRFFSGTRWEPPEDYVPTERPWYTKPMEHMGEITILEPYVDVQSGNTMLALGKSLCDKESVISVDVSLDQMQKLTEDAVVNGDTDIEMILAGDGTVVTHSDINEVGKNYNEEPGTLGAKIVKLINSSQKSYYDITYNGKHYIAYAAEFQGNWHCVSLRDATTVFDSINNVLFVTIVVVIVIVITIGFVLGNSIKRGLIAQRALVASDAKSSFLSNMSHEIRTPINAVLGMNEMILRESKDKQILAYSESVKLAGDTLLGIVNDILDFSKIEAGKLDIIPVSYNLTIMLNDLVNMVRLRVDEKGLTFNLEFDENVPKMLYGDEVRVKQVITNLLTNAVKYTEKGSVTFTLSYDKIEDSDDEIMLNVSIKDTGIGIKEEDIKKLYTEFERIEEKRNRNIEGTGLGMNITVSLLEMMGSTLSVKSVYGEGSEFSFSLRQKVEAWDRLGDFETSYKELMIRRGVSRERFTAPSANVLVVDDNPMNLVVFKNLLKQTEISVDTSESGDGGLELAAVNKYDVIFFDHMMPDKDGIETLHEMRDIPNHLNADTPVVCLTANAILGAKEQYLSEGFDDYMTKPVDYDKLEELLTKYIDDDKIEMVANTEEFIPVDESLPENLNKLSECDFIDVKAGVDNSGTVESYESLLKIFYSSIDENVDTIKDFYDAGDFKNYAIKVHALKSSARIIGAATFGEDAQALENAAKASDKAYIDKHHERFIADYMAFKEPLAAFGDEDVDDSGKPLADDAFIETVLEEIKAAAEEMDCDKLEEIFGEVAEYRIPDDKAELFKKLKSASDNFAYDEILECL